MDVRNVVDVWATPFTAPGAMLFMDSVRPRVDRLIDERNINNCFHLELI